EQQFQTLLLSFDSSTRPLEQRRLFQEPGSEPRAKEQRGPCVNMHLLQTKMAAIFRRSPRLCRTLRVYDSTSVVGCTRVQSGSQRCTAIQLFDSPDSPASKKRRTADLTPLPVFRPPSTRATSIHVNPRIYRSDRMILR